ncbi:uncharacterized protein LOC111255602 [Varroa destructor]|uniref:Uncharacterized protein n=1 Tax=Varroa destructor TaxID=109461 RepID=A0A7M7L827_VARDE|nr:uncharacterized protein LOC111255602 [Varroa destructor]
MKKIPDNTDATAALQRIATVVIERRWRGFYPQRYQSYLNKFQRRGITMTQYGNEQCNSNSNNHRDDDDGHYHHGEDSVHHSPLPTFKKALRVVTSHSTRTRLRHNSKLGKQRKTYD